MTGRFDDKVVLLTGAASGIGAAAARRFAREGGCVLLVDINDAAGAALAAEIGERAAFRHVDVRECAQVEQWVAGAVAHFGRVDVLLNNAGIGSYGKTPDVPPDLWRAVIDTDLHAVFYACRAAIPHLRAAGGGSIVNTASISGLGGDYGLAAYNAAKGGLVNYTRTLAIDHAREGIRVNAVCPGPIDTPLLGHLIARQAMLTAYEAVIPMGRIGRADEVASAIAFLASDDASYITGALLTVDGGITAATGQPNFSRLLGDA
jgi:meso-butanediol dehydrogenase / (S,S)-butanediol dehydrogenase / diacetyl reductase